MISEPIGGIGEVKQTPPSWTLHLGNPYPHSRFEVIILKKIIFTILLFDWRIQHFLIYKIIIKLAHPIKLNPSWEEGRKRRVYWLEDGRATEGWTSGSLGLFILIGGKFFIWSLLLTSAQFYIPFASSMILEIKIVFLRRITFLQRSFIGIYN